MVEDFEACYRAVQSRDARFDGWFFTAVRTTGVYCRPSCPATTPLAANVTFFPSAAAAQGHGYRACRRCRPDASPGSPAWDQRADTVARAMRLIADGVVDREGVGGLASRLGYSSRQLVRQMRAELGAGPLALARAQRAQTARLLIESSDLSLAEVAFAAGFGSVRQFNDCLHRVFGTTPRALRHRPRQHPSQAARHPSHAPRHGPQHGPGAAPLVAGAQVLELRLARRPPFSALGVFGHLAACAIPGVEEWRNGAFRRTLRLPHGPGVVGLSPGEHHVRCRLTLEDVRDLPAAIARCRRLLDLDADPEAVDAALRRDLALRGLVDAGPGRRVPRTVDEPELALRVVLAQQVSTGSARNVAAGLAESLGEPIADREGGLRRLFPLPAAVAAADPAWLPMPAARRRAVQELASAMAEDRVVLGPAADRHEVRRALRSVPGIGPWTTEMIAMRGLGDPDALPAGDLGVRRGAARIGLPTTPGALLAASAVWAPWRSYAVQYLWSALDHAVNRLPAESSAGPHVAAPPAAVGARQEDR